MIFLAIHLMANGASGGSSNDVDMLNSDFESSVPQSDDSSALPSNIVETQEARERLNLSGHRPIYLIYGDPSSKFQFSFKFRLAKETPFYFGYTQVMLWDLRQDSQPLRDVNYNPEFFYRLGIGKGFLDSVDIGPYDHKSNGRGSLDSRGYNRVFVQLNWLGIIGNISLKATTRFSYMYVFEPTNVDLMEYQGPLDQQFSVTEFLPGLLDKGEFYLRAFAGGRYGQYWGLGGQEVGVSFRLGNLGFNHSFYVQYYRGYSELLLNYSQFDSNVRFGFRL